MNFVVAFLVLISVSSFGSIIQDYDYPIKNPYHASISSVLARPKGFRSKRINIKIIKKGTIENPKNRGITAAYSFLEGEHPLVFIFSGFSGTYKTSTTELLGKLFNDSGYHAVLLSNPVSTEYSTAISTSGFVGYAPQDAKPIYGYLKILIQELIKLEQVQIKGFAVTGYSMGGLYAGFIFAHDRNERFFNFKKTLMINPPVNFKHGIGVLDQMFQQGEALPKERREHVSGTVVGFAIKSFIKKFFGKSIPEILDDLELTDMEIGWAISKYFLGEMHDVRFVQMTDKRKIKTKKNRSKSFNEFLQRLYLKGIMSHSEIQTFDDFLLDDIGIEWMNSVFGERAYVYPHGGHLGNIWVEQNKKDIKAIMTDI